MTGEKSIPPSEIKIDDMSPAQSGPSKGEFFKTINKNKSKLSVQYIEDEAYIRDDQTGKNTVSNRNSKEAITIQELSKEFSKDETSNLPDVLIIEE